MKKIITLLLCFLTFFEVSTLLSSKVIAAEWDKYANNPLLNTGTSGSWDSQHVLNPNIIKNNNSFMMWHDGNNGSGWKIGIANSPTGTDSWIRNNNSVLPVGSNDGWEKDISDPDVILKDNIYHLWYTSSDSSHWTHGSDRFRLRHATSTDGINWNRDPGWVITGTIGKWDEGGIARGKSIIFKDGIFHLWYAGTNTNSLTINPFWRIGHATSPDGINWTKQNNGNPVISPTHSWELNNVSYPHVIYENNKYKMWYAAGSLDLPIQIVFATSNDGITWTKPADKNPVLTLGLSGSFDSTYIASPFVLKDVGQYKMWYSGYDGAHWRIGYATASATLDVPFFSQKVDPWGSQEYDHVASISAWTGSTKFKNYGCAVTSSAMILNYHGMTNFADGTEINPGTLNDWLKNNNGYNYGSNKYGAYSGLKWTAISKLSKNLYDANKSKVKLEYFELKPASNSTAAAILNDDLSNKGNPDILHVKNNLTFESGHFVVAKGLTENGDYAINDPYWNFPTLSSFDEQTFSNGVTARYDKIGRFIPSQTNLSSITIDINPNIELLITDASGRKTGKIVQNEAVQEFNQIPEASYGFEPPIGITVENGNVQKLGTGMNRFFLSKPQEGNYTIALSSKELTDYSINISTSDTQANDGQTKTTGLVSPNSNDTFSLNYSQTQITPASPDITIDTFIADIKSAWKMKLITKKNTYDKLIGEAKDIKEDLWEMAKPRKKDKDKEKMKREIRKDFEKLVKFIEKERNRSIHPTAADILLDDIKIIMQPTTPPTVRLLVLNVQSNQQFSLFS